MENISDFDFYLKFTKPLILNLPEINDRVLAAAWVKKLATDANAEEKTKTEYIKLLLFVLQRKRLAPPFTQHPNAVDTLNQFPEDKTLVDVAKDIIAYENEERRLKLERQRAGECGDFPPYVSDFSGDLLEYVAVQNIENFGVHGYYAISKLPMSTWYRVDKQLLPKAAKSMIEASPPPPTFTESSADIPDTEQPPPADQPHHYVQFQQPSEPKEAEAEKIQSPRKKISALGASPPSAPIGKLLPPVEEREPPSWGSNLLEPNLMGEELEDFEDDLPSSAQQMEVLWPSSPTHAGFLDEEPADAAWTSAASLPYLTPPPPPLSKRPAKKKAAPQPKPTRSSLLLRKKTEDMAKAAAAATAKKKPPPRASKITKGSEEGEAKVASKRPSKGKVTEKPSKAKLTEKPSKGSVAEKPSKGKLPEKAGKGKATKRPSAAAAPNEVDEFLAEYDKTLQELERDFKSDMALQKQQQQKEQAKAGAPSGKLRKPKRQLSKLAKTGVKKIPKGHGVPTDVDQSIHVSATAREIYEDITGEASTSQRPQPRIPAGVIEEDDEQIGEIEGADEAVAGAAGVDYAIAEGPTGHAMKDPRMMETYNRMVDMSLQEGATGDEAYEEMERMVEEEMKRQGKDPHGKKKKKKKSREEMAQGMSRYLDVHRKADQQMGELDVALRHLQQETGVPSQRRPLSPVYEEDEEEKEEWVGADAFFQQQGAKERKAHRPSYPQRTVVPLDQIPDYEKQELEEFGVLPENLIDEELSKTGDINQLYRDFSAADPAFAGVPVTSPRLGGSPHRPVGAAKGALADFLKSSPGDPFGLPEYVGVSTFEPKPLTLHVGETKAVRPASPQKTEEELAELRPEDLEFPPESYQFQYQYTSPERQPIPMKELPIQQHPTLSPSNDWYWLDVAERMYGTPPQLFHPQVSPGTPPIDVDKLKKDIAENADIDKDWFYADRVGPEQIWVQRYPLRIGQLRPIAEVPDYLTEEDAVIRKDILEFDYDDVPERHNYRFPYKHKQSVVKRHSAAPKLDTVREVYESPPPEKKLVPDMFDLPELERLEAESPPHAILTAGAVSPAASPEVDWEAFKGDVRAGAVTAGQKPGLVRKSRAPYLSAVPERKEWQLLPAPYQRSPVSSRQYIGPKPKSIKKQLRKRRLDFSVPPESQDESKWEMTDIYTEVDDLPVEGDEAGSPGVEEMLGQIREEAQQGSPRTPPHTGLLHEVQLPEIAELPDFPQMETDVLGAVEEPQVDELPDFYPLSPMSEYDTMKRILDEVKAYQPPERPPQRPKYLRPRKRQIKAREFYKRYPWRKLEDIYDLENSPPHQREYFEALQSQQGLPAEDVFGEEEMPPGFASPPPLPAHLVAAPTTSLSPEQAELEEFERFERAAQSPRVNILEAAPRPMGRVPGLTEAQYAALAATPPRQPQLPIEKRAAAQYYSLRPERAPGELSPETAAMLQYHQALTSPELRAMQQLSPPAQPELVQFDYAETVTEQKPKKAVRSSKAIEAAKKKAGIVAPKQKAAAAKQKPIPAKGKEVKQVKSDKSLKSQKSDKSLKSQKSDKSLKSQKSDKSLKSQKSDQSITKPKRQKYKAVSKIDTGRKKPEPAPAVDVEYDMEALQELGVSEADLRRLNLNDLQADVAQLEAAKPKKQLKRPPGKPVPAAEPKQRKPLKRPPGIPVPGTSKTKLVAQGIPKPRKSKYNVVSKLDTGRKPKAPKPKPVEVQPEPEPEQATTLEVVAADRRFARPSQRAPRLPALVETEEEYKPSSPIKFGDMRWHLSPQRRVDLRLPDIKVLPVPLQEAERLPLERVELQLPARPAYKPLHPMPERIDTSDLLPYLEVKYDEIQLEDDGGEDLVGTDQPDFDEEPPEFDLMEHLFRQSSAVQSPDYHLAEEGAPYDIYSQSPERLAIKRKTPLRPPPVSPSNLAGELEAHEIYDPDREHMKRKVQIGGRRRPLGAERPGLSPVYEGTPPKQPLMLMNTTPEQIEAIEAFVNAAQSQYEDLMAPSPLRRKPSPPTPTPEQLRRMVDAYDFDPRIYKKKWARKRRPRLAAPKEIMEYSPEFHIPEDELEDMQAMSPPMEYPQTPPDYYEPPQVEEEVVLVEEEEPEFPQTPPRIPRPPIVVEEKYREMMPSPPRPKRISRGELPPLEYETHGLPQVSQFKTPPMPATPKRTPVPKAERTLPRRRLAFEQSPAPSPEPDSPVTILTVEAEEDWPLGDGADDLGLEDEPSFMHAESPGQLPPSDLLGGESPPMLFGAESPPMMPQAESPPMLYRAVTPTSPNVPVERPLSEEQKGFKWLEAHVAPDLPWE